MNNGKYGKYILIGLAVLGLSLLFPLFAVSWEMPDSEPQNLRNRSTDAVELKAAFDRRKDELRQMMALTHPDDQTTTSIIDSKSDPQEYAQAEIALAKK